MDYDDEKELIEDIRKSLDSIDPQIDRIVIGIDVIKEAFEETTDLLPMKRKQAFAYGIVTYLAKELDVNVVLEGYNNEKS